MKCFSINDIINEKRIYESEKMGKKYFVFKLNLGPDILELYKFDMKQIRYSIIPDDLKKIFISKDLENSTRYSCTVKQNDFRDSELYSEFMELSDIHEQKYLAIVKIYQKTGGFNYSPDYQKLNNRFGKLLGKILREYPYLESAFNITDPKLSEDLEFKVGTGKKYVERQRKIKRYLRNQKEFIKKVAFDFYYEKNSEFIYINENQSRSIFFANIIQEEINKNKNLTNIGEVSINPISEKVELNIKQKAPIKEISLSYVYPNGKKEVDERNAAIKKIKADREKRTYSTSSKTGFSVENIEDLAEEEGRKGYLSDILHKGRSVVKWVQLEILKDFK